MRAIGGKLWGWLWKALSWRVTIPRLCWRAPLGVILAILIVGFTGTGFVMHQTSRPLFCLSCHEMTMPVNA